MISLNNNPLNCVIYWCNELYLNSSNYLSSSYITSFGAKFYNLINFLQNLTYTQIYSLVPANISSFLSLSDSFWVITRFWACPELNTKTQPGRQPCVCLTGYRLVVQQFHCFPSLVIGVRRSSSVTARLKEDIFRRCRVLIAVFSFTTLAAGQ